MKELIYSFDFQMHACHHAVMGRDFDEMMHSSAFELLFTRIDDYFLGVELCSLGKNRQELMDLLDFVMPFIPTDKPNHLLGNVLCFTPV